MNRRLYTLGLGLVLPLALLRLFWRSRRAPGYRRRVAERFARVPLLPQGPRLWVHAVSVGEVQVAAPLIRRLQDDHPGLDVVVTTTTPTGAARVAELLGGRVRHFYTPYDLPVLVRRFLDRIGPGAAVFVETEVWPNILAGCAARGIPCLLANARLSERSLRGYRRLGEVAREAFGGFQVIAAQTEEDAARYRALGVPPERIRVFGSVKFDLEVPPSAYEQADAIKRLWGDDRPVWIAASTHEGEEEQVLEAHRLLLKRLPRALLVIVPRHPERFGRVAALVRRRGLGLARRSEMASCGPDVAVFLGDTMGELPMFLAAGDLAFIGGSLVAHGGHNPLEAAAVGVPVLFGPHMVNFAAIARLLLAAGAACQVADVTALVGCLETWLSDASARSEAGEAGRGVVAANRGALARLQAEVAAAIPGLTA